MPRFTFENKFTFGNLIQIVLLLVAMAFGWQALSGTVSAHTSDIASLQKAIAPVETLNVRLTVLESRAAATDQQISTLLGSIDRLVDEMNADRVNSAQIKTDVGYLRSWVEDQKRASR